MRVVVCVRRLQNGELNPFDACAYEAALRLEGAEVTLLSMGPMTVKELLSELTRLGAKDAILLSDSAFAGADTLATAYTLSLALKKLCPDLVICGRQTVDGDTGQVGPELATLCGYSLLTNVMSLTQSVEGITAETRLGEQRKLSLPALITLEKINTLRLPRLRSKKTEALVWSAEDIGADTDRTGQKGSPTRVLESFKNQQDRRRCCFITPQELMGVIGEALAKESIALSENEGNGKKLQEVWTVGEAPMEMARTVAENIRVIPLTDAEDIAKKIREGSPRAVLWGSDLSSKRIAPQVAAMLSVGLCADCTRLETDGKELYMYRPAFGGNIIAKIRCDSSTVMATVRTRESGGSPIAIGVGFGVRQQIKDIRAFAESLGADVVATRKTVDHDYMPYEAQVGLTGKSISPRVYIAIGVSGAVHHIAGMKSSGTVIAVNPDREAEIFKYADYGIVCDFEEIKKSM